MIDYQKIGERIKLFRAVAGVTQEKLAEWLDVSSGYVSRVERGTRWLNLERLSEVATLLEVPITSLLADTGEDQEDAYAKSLLPLTVKLTLENKSLLLDFAELLLKRQ